jgi:hypothetical protein
VPGQGKGARHVGERFGALQAHHGDAARRHALKQQLRPDECQRTYILSDIEKKVELFAH